MLFLSEPQVYQCDIDRIMHHLTSQYSFCLNSTDIYEPDLPLTQTKATGGTQLLKWGKVVKVDEDVKGSEVVKVIEKLEVVKKLKLLNYWTSLTSYRG